MQEFPIAAASARPLWMFLPILLIVGGVLSVALLGAYTSRAEISSQGLRLRGDFYGRLIPPGQLRVDEARPVDFELSPELRPRRRTLGTGLPGYQGGWFRLANGERALLYLTDRRRAVYVPTTAGYSVLLSPDDPTAFLAALKRLPAR